MAISIDENSLVAEKVVEFFDNYILRAGSYIINDAVNTGRRESAVDFDAKGAQYSAYLEGNVCDFCRAIDGMTVRFDDEEGYILFEKYSPAQHPECNCFWVYILEGEKFEDNNKDFEKKWMEEFRKQNPGKDWSKAKILDRYAQFNVYYTRSHLWKDDWKDLIEVRKEVIARRRQIAEKGFMEEVKAQLLNNGETGVLHANIRLDREDDKFSRDVEINGQKVEITQYGRKDSEINSLQAYWERQIPAEHLKGLKEIEFINSPLLDLVNGKNVQGYYLRLEKKIILTRNFQIEGNERQRFSLQEMIGTSLHELGHHYHIYHSNANDAFQIHKIFNALIDNDRYGIIDARRTEKEFFAESYKLYRVRQQTIVDIDGILDELRRDNKIAFPYDLSSIFKEIFGE